MTISVLRFERFRCIFFESLTLTPQCLLIHRIFLVFLCDEGEGHIIVLT